MSEPEFKTLDQLWDEINPALDEAYAICREAGSDTTIFDRQLTVAEWFMLRVERDGLIGRVEEMEEEAQHAETALHDAETALRDLDFECDALREGRDHALELYEDLEQQRSAAVAERNALADENQRLASRIDHLCAVMEAVLYEDSDKSEQARLVDRVRAAAAVALTRDDALAKGGAE